MHFHFLPLLQAIVVILHYYVITQEMPSGKIHILFADASDFVLIASQCFTKVRFQVYL